MKNSRTFKNQGKERKIQDQIKFKNIQEFQGPVATLSLYRQNNYQNNITFPARFKSSSCLVSLSIFPIVSSSSCFSGPDIDSAKRFPSASKASIARLPKFSEYFSVKSQFQKTKHIIDITQTVK